MSLELEEVRKSYRQPDGSDVPVLDVPAYSLAAGQQAALVGASGGGKTTLLNVIAGITPADAGRITVAGHNTTTLPEAALDRFRARFIGIVFQTFNLLPGFTAYENVLLGMTFAGRVDRQLAAELLDNVGLSHRRSNRPGQLSVGEQQRVAVARALANRPALMLADEPTASVDVANQTRIVDLLKDTCREHDVALLVVTHSPEAAAMFGRVDRLEDVNRAARRTAVPHEATTSDSS